MKKEPLKIGRPVKGIDAGVRKERKGELALIIGDRVLKRRQLMGLSREQLAEVAGISPNTVKRIEKALMDQKLSAIEAVAKALNYKFTELVA